MLVGIGVVGYGYWGPNVVRNFQSIDRKSVRCICDLNVKALERAKVYYPEVRVTADIDTMLESQDIDAVAIVTPVRTHYALAKKSLSRGKHIFVEKPFTENSTQAQELIELADKNNLIIMVDHTFLFTPAVKKIKELIEKDVLGGLYYYDSMRVNLGLLQSDVNVMWDLAAHDLSIMLHLLNKKPEAVVAAGQKHINGVEDVAYIIIYFPDNVIAHFNVNWLSPVKMRTTLIGGSKKMIVWNDLESYEKIKVYDKGVKADSGEGIYDMLVSYRLGDVWSPRLDQTEALNSESQYFIHCIENNQTPFNDGMAGLRVVQMLEAANESMRMRGGVVYI
jgi:predicted dehydrogenase